MSFEEEFDKIMQQKADGAEFPFEQGNLDKLGFLLDARNAAAPAVWWKKMVLPLAATLVIGSAAYLYFTSESTELVEENLVTIQTNKSETQATEINSSINNNQKTASAAIQAPEKVVSKTDENSSTLTINTKPITHIRVATKPVETEAADEHSVDTKQLMDEGAQPLTEAIKTEGPASENSSSTPAHSEATTLSTSDFKEAVDDEAEAKISAEVPVVNQELTQITWLTPITAELEPTAFSDLSTAEPVILKRYEEDYYQSPFIKNYLAAQGGAHYGLGWKVGNAQDGVGLNYFGGLELGHNFNQKVGISAGLQYYQFTNMYKSYYTSLVKGYGFGYTDAYSAVTTDVLQYIAVPIKLGYHINKASVIGIGVNTAYLFAGHSRVDSYGVSDGVKGPVSSVAGNKIYAGSNDINVMGSIFVQSRVQKRLSVFAEFQYGITDLFKDYTTKVIKQKSTGIRLGLNLYLFEK